MSLFGGLGPDETQHTTPFPSAQQERDSAASSLQGVEEDEAIISNSSSPLSDGLTQFLSDSQGESEISESEDKVPQHGEAAQKPGPSRKRRWLRYTANEREVINGLDMADTRDLTRHLLNAHGMAARQYPRAHPDLSLLHPRNYWIPEWIPPHTWTGFPNLPDEVPRRQEQVWPSSITKTEVWRPGIDLEDAVFAAMLRKGTKQWNVREQDLSPEIDTPGVENEDSEHPSTITPANLENNPGTSSPENASAARKRKRDEVDDPDRPVLCADDDRQWRLLKPSVKSIVTNFDKLLLALDQSRRGSSKYFKGKGRDVPPTSQQPSVHNLNSHNTVDSVTLDSKRDKSRNMSDHKEESQIENPGLERVFQPVAHLHPNAPRDWSQVLGFASILDIPPAAISRAATRCAAAFGEGMSFRQIAEKDTVTADVTFTPADVVNPSLELKFAPKKPKATVKMTWDYNTVTKCPFPRCRWAIRDGETRTKSRLGEHLRRVHKIADPTQGMHEVPAEKDGAVHGDGFLQPIQAYGGGRGRGKKWAAPLVPSEPF